MPSRVQHVLDFHYLCLRPGLLCTRLSCAIYQASSVTCVDIIPAYTTMARTLRHGSMAEL
jgi:hypothetical protein